MYFSYWKCIFPIKKYFHIRNIANIFFISKNMCMFFSWSWNYVSFHEKRYAHKHLVFSWTSRLPFMKINSWNSCQYVLNTHSLIALDTQHSDLFSIRTRYAEKKRRGWLKMFNTLIRNATEEQRTSEKAMESPRDTLRDMIKKLFN